MATTTEFTLPEATAVLARTPAVLNALLRGLPNTWVRGNEGLGKDGKPTWIPFDIVGHLIGGERTDWMRRARPSTALPRKKRVKASTSINSSTNSPAFAKKI